MTKITLTWQEDAQHEKPFNEEVEIQNTDLETGHYLTKAESLNVCEEFKPLTKLTALEGSAIVAALDDGIEQLSIIKFIINENGRASWNELFKYQPLAERFKTTPKQKQKFEEEVYEKIPYNDHQKLQKDVCFLISTLTEMSREILAEGDYQVIISVLEGIKQEEEDNVKVEAQRSQHEAELESLKKTLVKEKKELTKALEEKKACIGELKNVIEDVYAYGKQELRYTEDWENARTYQNEIILTAQEDVYNLTISDHLAKIESEGRIHNEIQNFIEENTEDLQKAINYWMQHYDNEIDRRDSEIIRLKMIWEEMSEGHVALKALYAEHLEFVLERRALNAERKRLAEEFRVQTAAAIRIQAWWRGTMVRKKLGPFRVKKKGKGKDKDKGKGKGGKKKK